MLLVATGHQGGQWIAYYLMRRASVHERRDHIVANDIKKYFTQAILSGLDHAGRRVRDSDPPT
jgi:hypothetical protein